MNDSTGTSYWFTEHGEWGTVPVEHVYFGPEHHASIYDSFELVSDWEYPEWAVYLAKNAHAYTGEQDYCETCETLVEQFHDTKRAN